MLGWFNSLCDDMLLFSQHILYYITGGLLGFICLQIEAPRCELTNNECICGLFELSMYKFLRFENVIFADKLLSRISGPACNCLFSYVMTRVCNPRRKRVTVKASSSSQSA
jgi:hypothetical protein